MSREIEFHPLANMFPLMEGIGFRELVEDIRIHGLREPIILYEGAILDGRNRWRACNAAQVAARFKTYDGKDAFAFVVSSNLHRRHLDASQRALIAAEIIGPADSRRSPKFKAGVRRGAGGRIINRPLKNPDQHGWKDPKYPATPSPPAVHVGVSQAAELLNVCEPTIKKAERVLSAGVPELVAAVRTGDVSVHAAQHVAKLPKEQQAKIMQAGGPAAVRAIGSSARDEEKRDRLIDRRETRAAEGASSQAVFDHLKIGDGRSIGNVSIGEARRVAESLLLVADVLFAVLSHAPSANHGQKIRDTVSPSVLAGLIENVRRMCRA